MKEFTQSMPFIIFVMVLVLFIQMTLGTETANSFLWLVLLSMLLINNEEIKNLLERVKP